MLNARSIAMRNFFVALLLFIVVLMPTQADAPMATNLVFLNFPEKVLQTGNLGKQTIKESSKTRIFFHYLNATGRDQVFNFKLKGKLEKYKFAVDTNFEPGLAGSNATKKFLLLNYQTVINPGFELAVRDKDTVSGIIEAIMHKGDSWTCKLGNDSKTPDLKIINISNYEIEKFIDLKENKPYTFRLGDDRKEIIPGHYGYDYSFYINNADTKKKRLICSIDSRAGSLTGVFKINDTVISTAELSAKQETIYFNKVIDVDSPLKITYIPTGGYSYPVQFKFKLIAI
jgi:hypothetical protein